MSTNSSIAAETVETENAGTRVTDFCRLTFRLFRAPRNSLFGITLIETTEWDVVQNINSSLSKQTVTYTYWAAWFGVVFSIGFSFLFQFVLPLFSLTTRNSASFFHLQPSRSLSMQYSGIASEFRVCISSVFTLPQTSKFVLNAWYLRSLSVRNRLNRVCLCVCVRMQVSRNILFCSSLTETLTCSISSAS